MTLHTGSRLGIYEIVGLIGAGGMGEVYRARDTRLNRDVAIKVVPEAFVADADRLARFQREAQILAALNHPNIATVHGLEAAGSGHALVMELVDGPTLADRVAQGPLAVAEALTIATQLVEALSAAHDRGIIHRDLKPANIKVPADGAVKVLDFGLAKGVEPAASGTPLVSASPTITTPAMTQMGIILGTATYMSPEQAKGRQADKRSDIWAFGCVLYEMLTGRRAFDGEDVSDTLASVLKSEPDWAALPTDLPPAALTLLKACLAKDPRARVRDIAAAHFVLAHASALPATAVSVERRRPRGLFIGTAVVAVVALSTIAVLIWRQPSVEPRVSKFAFDLPADQQFPATGRPLLTSSPDGSRFVYATATGLALRSVEEFEPQIIPGTEGRTGQAHSPAFSPDGRSVAYYSSLDFREGAIMRTAATGGAPTTVCTTETVMGLSWDESGILFAKGTTGVFRCPSGGGPVVQLTKVATGELVFGPRLLPGGKAVMFTVANAADGPARWDRATVVAESLDSHQRKPLVRGGSDGRYVAPGYLLYAVGGVVYALKFDPDRLEVSGEPTPVIEGIRRAIGASTGVAHMTVSEDGTLVYIPGPVRIANDQVQLAIADDAGKVTPLMLPPLSYDHVRSSRTGNRIAIGVDNGTEANVYLHELGSSSAPRKLTLDGASRFPIWHSDGLRVTFQSTRDKTGALYQQRFDGTGPVKQMTRPVAGEAHIPEDWSPDGRYLLYSVAKDGVYTLHVLTVGDGKVAPFGGVTSAEPISATFSPNGRWVAYASTARTLTPSASGGVFVQPFPATGEVHAAPKILRDFQPVWARSGDTLFYVPTAVSGQIAAVAVTFDPAPNFGSPRLFRALVTANRLSGQPRAFDVLPDKGFIGIGSPESSAAPSRLENGNSLNVILNWVEELKRRVPLQ